MLLSLTATAVRRGWPPAVYARLVSQLRDSEEARDDKSVWTTLRSLIRDSPPNVLLYEYIVLLSSESYSLLACNEIVEFFASETAEDRPQSSSDLMAYLAREGVDTWDFKTHPVNAAALDTLLDQALNGCQESRLFMLAIINHTDVDVPPAKRAALRATASKSSAGTRPAETEEASETPVAASEEQTERSRHASTRSTRLLWLDWVLRSAQNLSYLPMQLELMWPGDRMAVTAYELCVTAFDVLATSGDDNELPLAKPFITKRLPLLLRDLVQGSSLDSVVARLFTTLDKHVVESVEAKFPQCRAEFGIACTDLGLCDASVLHVLHRNHVPQPPLSNPDETALQTPDYSWSQFLEMDTLSQQHIAQSFAALVRVAGPHGPISRHVLARHCAQFYNKVEITDTLFVHVSARDFIECVCAHVDAAAMLPEEGGVSGFVYADLGVLIAGLDLWTTRYNCELPENSWASQSLSRKMFGNVIDLTAEQKTLMGQWIIGLFSGSSSGIADELLKPFSELSVVLPVLLQQGIRAYRSAVIDRDTLKTGLDYFLQQQSVTLFTPLTLRVLFNDLLEGMHPSTSLECLVFFLSLLAPKQGPEFDMTMSIIAPILLKLQELLNMAEAPAASRRGSRSGTPKAANPVTNIVDTTITNIRHLIAELSPLITECLNRAGVSSSSKSVAQPLSFAELVTSHTALLMNWQLKPQGVPCAPGFLISRKVKPALGASKTRELVQKVVLNKTQSSLDTYWALLVADGLWSGGSVQSASLFSAQCSSNEQPALDLLEKLERVLDEIRAKEAAKPAVVVRGEPAVAPAVPDAKELPEQKIDAGDMMNMMETDMMTDGAGFLNDLGDGGFEAYGFDSQQPDFDGDFSKPMDLADLDSAMDFGWE